MCRLDGAGAGKWPAAWMPVVRTNFTSAPTNLRSTGPQLDENRFFRS
ncbi:MAG: hypothetical protein ACTSU5_07940 [Promethearchaeota archaeon]